LARGAAISGIGLVRFGHLVETTHFAAVPQDFCWICADCMVL